LVLIHLEVNPGQPEDRPLEAGPLLAPLVEPSRDPLDVRYQSPTDLVHDVVAEPLEPAHDRLRLAEEAALPLAHERLHPVLAVAFAAERPTDRPEGVAAEVRGRATEQAELPLEPVGEVR